MTDTPVERPPTNEKKRSRRWMVEVGIVGVAYATITRFQTSDLLADGTHAPPFDTFDIDGTPLSLAQYAGKPLVLHFWASWCGVCRQEFGMLNDFDKKHGQLLTLVAEEPSDKIKAFVRSHDLRYPIAYAPEALVRAYKISAYPTTYYLTKEHQVSSSTVGMSTGLAMRARLALAS